MIHFDPSIKATYERRRKELTKSLNARIVLRARGTLVGNHIEKIDVRNGKFQLVADEPSQIGGEDKGPSPMEYFLAGYVACTGAMFIWNAAAKDLKLDEVIIESKGIVRSEAVYGLEGESGLDRVETVINIKTQESPARMRELMKQVDRSCPAYNALVKPVDVQVKVLVNQQEL